MTTIKICTNCKNEFSIYYFKDGVKKHSDKRKFCYGCSPIGNHNTKPSLDGSIKSKRRETKIEMERICDVCKNLKVINDFYKGHKSCKSCHNMQVLDKQRALKKQCVQYLGGKCCVCGYDKYQGSMEFHHRDPSKKDFGLSHYIRHNFEFLKTELDKKIVIYIRVSSTSQKDDLKNQIEFLKQFTNAKGWIVENVLTDIGSGLNFKRKNWNSILKRVQSGEISKVIVAHKDRFLRFGFEWFENFLQNYECELIVVNNETLSPQEKLVQDLISIIHTFSCRIYGLRKYKKVLNGDKDVKGI